MARDYRAEYQQRIARGLAAGKTRAEARGHGKPPKQYDKKLEDALRDLRDSQKQGTQKPLTSIAKAHHADPERVRRYGVQAGVLEKRKGRWVVGRDDRPRRILVFSRGEARIITVPNYEAAARIGEYMAAVAQFVDTGDYSLIEPFIKAAVKDIKNRRHPFETDPNVLYILTEPGGPSFEAVYSITA